MVSGANLYRTYDKNCDLVLFSYNDDNQRTQFLRPLKLVVRFRFPTPNLERQDILAICLALYHLYGKSLDEIQHCLFHPVFDFDFSFCKPKENERTLQRARLFALRWKRLLCGFDWS